MVGNGSLKYIYNSVDYTNLCTKKLCLIMRFMNVDKKISK